MVLLVPPSGAATLMQSPSPAGVPKSADLQVSTMLFHYRDTPDRDERLMRRFAAAMSLIDHGLTGPPTEHAPRGRSKSVHA